MTSKIVDISPNKNQTSAWNDDDGQELQSLESKFKKVDPEDDIIETEISPSQSLFKQSGDKISSPFKIGNDSEKPVENNDENSEKSKVSSLLENSPSIRIIRGKVDTVRVSPDHKIKSVKSDIPVARPRKIKSAQTASPDKSIDLSTRSQDISQRSSITQLSSIHEHDDDKKNTEGSHVDNIRRRVQAAKERAGLLTHTKQRLRRKSPASSLPTSSSNLLVEDDDEVEEALNKHKEARKRWKHLALVNRQVHSLEAEFDFFTRGSNKSTDIQSSQDKSSVKDDAVGNDDSCLDEEVRLVNEGNNLLSYMFPSPESPDTKDKLRAILFCPSSSPVPVEEKLGGDGVVRVIADEGLYVNNDNKQISWKSKNKLEQRIMAAAAEKYWFGEDGELKCISKVGHLKYKSSVSPKRRSTQPIDSLLTYMPACKGWPAVSLNSVVTVNEDVANEFVLQIDIGRIAILQHQLFTREHQLSYNIYNLINLIHRRESEGIVMKLFARIESICDSRQHSDLLWEQTNDPIHKYRVDIYNKEVRRIGSDWIREIKKTNELIKQVHEYNKELGVLRQRQGFAYTDIYVSFNKNHNETTHPQSQFSQLLHRVGNEIKQNEVDKLKSRKEEKRTRKLQQLRDDPDQSDDGSSNPSSSSSDENDERIEDNDDNNSLKIELESKVRPSLSYSSKHHQFPLPPQSFLLNYEKEFGKGIIVSFRMNNKEIGRAVGRPHVSPSNRPNFTFNVQHRFSVKLTSKPTSLYLYLFLPRRAISQTLSSIQLTLPLRLQTDEVEWNEMEWMSSDTLGIKGNISIRSGWKFQIPYFLYDTFKSLKTGVSLDESGDANFDLTKFEPNTSFDSSRQKKDTEGGRGAENEFEFCSEKYLETDARLRVLYLRNQGEPEFINMKCIPLNSNHLQPNIFKAYERRISGKSSLGIGTTNINISSISTQGLSAFDSIRNRDYQNYDQLKSNIFKQLEINHKKTTQHYVNEPPIYDFYMLFNSFVRWLQAKYTSKNSLRTQSLRVPVRNMIGQQVEVMITVVRGLQIPVRHDSDWKSSNKDGISYVRSFVEICYKNIKERTFTSEGSNPTWNHQIHIPIKVNDDKNICDGGNVEVILYDEIVEDMLCEDKHNESEIHVNKQRCYLGNINIPVHVIATNPWIEGTFEVNTPSSLLGYARESKELGNKTYLNLQIEVQPTLTTLPSRIKEELVDSLESEELYSYLKNWSQCIRQDFPGLHFNSLVITTQAKTVSITRLISPLIPPVMYIGQSTTAEMAARFVSLIPNTMKTCSSSPINVWLTADELVGGCCGERKDKAVLLTCYFLGLGYKAWLCLGQSLPQGTCHWVLTKDSGKDGTIRVWDPDTARCYSAGEPFCPLVKPHSIVDSTNIWINSDERPGWDGRLDLSQWRACLQSRNIQLPPTIQPPTMSYMDTSDTTQLQDKLNKLLRHAVMKLRPTTRTIWNRYCSSALGKLLPKLEQENCLGNITSSPSHNEHISHILSSYKMYGVALNSGFTSSADAVQMIKSCGIHLNTNPNIEFALSVYVHSYPSNVLSLWIYIASLQTRR